MWFSPPLLSIRIVTPPNASPRLRWSTLGTLTQDRTWLGSWLLLELNPSCSRKLTVDFPSTSPNPNVICVGATLREDGLHATASDNMTSKSTIWDPEFCRAHWLPQKQMANVAGLKVWDEGSTDAWFCVPLGLTSVFHGVMFWCGDPWLVYFQSLMWLTYDNWCSQQLNCVDLLLNMLRFLQWKYSTNHCLWFSYKLMDDWQKSCCHQACYSLITALCLK